MGRIGGRWDVSDRAERIAWFKTCVLPHESGLRRFLRRVGAPDMDLDDLVSEALTRTYAAEDWSRITNGRSYLFTIARNLILDAARRQKIVAFEAVADLDALGLVDSQPSAEAIVTTRDELRVLQAAVDRLPPRAREVFLLRRVENLSQRQVGERLNLSVSTVEGHFTKAMAALTKALQDSDPINGRTRDRHGEPRGGSVERAGGRLVRASARR
ncbi:MAG: sigma-70 family RNA polymerase sigma factor [Phenylobacterium sp.]|nr:sigma-70 family RNA polymerase sigma factor [Phenylobacterium sp.]